MKKKKDENIFIGDSGTFERVDAFSVVVTGLCASVSLLLVFLGIMIYVG